MSVAAPTVLVLPGWQNSGPEHWQSRWQAAHPHWRRVEQADWLHPPPPTGWPRSTPPRKPCWPTGAAGAQSWLRDRRPLGRHRPGRRRARVRHAFLVASPDVERADRRAGRLCPRRAPLPFPATLVASRDDPYCRFERAQALAADWQAASWDVGTAGHVNADAGFGDWPEGHARLMSVLDGEPHAG
jgi:predicted alpha/beta hydrolase family esterase